MAAPAPRPSDGAWLAAPGETLCLDFANTRFWRGSPQPTETLAGWPDLLAWFAGQAGLPAPSASSLAAWGRTDPAAAAQEFAAALALREALYRVFAARADELPVPAGELDRLNVAMAALPSRSDLCDVENGSAWRVATAPSPQQLLTPVLWSAGDLLTSRRLIKVRRCANPQCVWLFLDDSKSGNRRWCSMSSCGNRAKAHRHYLKRKADEGG